MAGFVYRENRVPHYQRLFQRKDGIPDRWKTPRSPLLLYPFYAATAVCLTSSMYMMGRMVLGHKTWFGKD
ncbi:uncharacterized protein PV09_04246 [Verruconis gallopava]|uniref:Uncharacterized protein n=1 Tax=Verruconis gallopava TaxID=253628 RepID=A0A0D1YV19_9PEZI|nr:uncharacterized protein PV09_04246 [Verruconis gallopava]KIW04487.1 hypothetical protein PV09_04246 [Verruconis gallopava]